MINHFKRLMSQVLIYGLGDAINKLAAILILPLFTHYLTPANYGVAAILTVTTTLLSGVADLGILIGVYRYYPGEDEKTKIRIISVAQIVVVGLTVIMSALAIFFAAPLSQLFFNTTQYSHLLVLNFLAMPFTVFIIAPLAQFKLEDKAKFTAGFKIFKVLLDLGVKTILIVGLNRGVLGLFEGQLYAAIICAIVMAFYSLKRTKFYFSIELFKKMLSFGLPSALSPVSFWVLNWADRFILGKIATITEVGLYTLGYTMGMAIMIPITAFETAWQAAYVSISTDPRAKQIYALILSYYTLIIVFIALIIVIFSRDYFEIFTTGSFHGAWIVVPVITLAYILRGNYTVMTAASFIAKKTIFILITEISAAVVNVILLFVLIPHLGRMGAAWATALAFLILPVLMYVLTRKSYRIYYEWVRIIQIFSVGGLIFWLCQLVYAPTWQNILLRVGLIMLYPVLLYITNFFKREELVVLRDALNKYTKFKKTVEIEE